MAYADWSEEKKERSREANRKWRTKVDRSEYYRNYDKTRKNKKERQAVTAQYLKDNPDKAKLYRSRWEGKQVKEYKLWWSARKRATAKNLPFDIEQSDIVIPEVCPVCDTELLTPSLDQVNPGEGYTKDNLAVMCRECNVIKNMGSAQRHRDIANFMDDFNSKRHSG